MEHVEFEDHAAIWEDQARVMKAGATGYHAVDCYLGDETEEHVEKRIDTLLEATRSAGLSLVQPPSLERPARFRSHFASNPDLAMYAWNQKASTESRVKRRMRLQSVSLGLILRKVS